jgi:hypothetical protein
MTTFPEFGHETTATEVGAAFAEQIQGKYGPVISHSMQLQTLITHSLTRGSQSSQPGRIHGRSNS